jgi:hypothetical protein
MARVDVGSASGAGGKCEARSRQVPPPLASWLTVFLPEADVESLRKCSLTCVPWASFVLSPSPCSVLMTDPWRMAMFDMEDEDEQGPEDDSMQE